MLGRVRYVLSGAREWSSICFVNAVRVWPVTSSVASILACIYLLNTFKYHTVMVNLISGVGGPDLQFFFFCAEL